MISPSRFGSFALAAALALGAAAALPRVAHGQAAAPTFAAYVVDATGKNLG